jgi:hypothetical protein
MESKNPLQLLSFLTNQRKLSTVSVTLKQIGFKETLLDPIERDQSHEIGLSHNHANIK